MISFDKAINSAPSTNLSNVSSTDEGSASARRLLHELVAIRARGALGGFLLPGGRAGNAKSYRNNYPNGRQSSKKKLGQGAHNESDSIWGRCSYPPIKSPN